MAGVKRTKKPAKVNVRRKKFVKNLVSGMGVGESALRAGYAHKTEGTALLREPSVLTALQTAMDKAGIDDEYLSCKIKEGLNAEYPEKLRKDGSVLQPSAPDFFVRQLYLDKALKIRGDYAPEKSIQENRTLTINLNMSMAKGLIDCGIIEPEEIQRLEEGDVYGRVESGARSLLGEGVQACRENQEDSGESDGVQREADAEQVDIERGVSEEVELREGPGETGTLDAGSSRDNV